MHSVQPSFLSFITGLHLSHSHSDEHDYATPKPAVCIAGASAPELQYLELFCNPNAATNAFNAKVLVTVKSHDGVSVLTETLLTSLKSDLDLCKQKLQVAA